ncbi:hypothetical protein YB2330_005608 [Saitoella coloradoensis]
MSSSSVSYSEPNNKEIGSLKQSEQGTPTDTAGDAAHGTYGTASGLPRKGPSKDPGLFGGGEAAGTDYSNEDLVPENNMAGLSKDTKPKPAEASPFAKAETKDFGKAETEEEEVTEQQRRQQGIDKKDEMNQNVGA